MKTVKFTKGAATLDSRGVRYSFDDYGNIKYPEGWLNAFREIGFERISREEAEEALPFEDPMELQDSNTYNGAANVAEDINYGLNQIPMEAPSPYAGQTLLVFKVHQGGDIRGAYSKNKYMVIDQREDMLIHDIYPVLEPEIDFQFIHEGEVIASGMLMSGGYVEFTQEHPNVTEDDVWELIEESGSRHQTMAEV